MRAIYTIAPVRLDNLTVTVLSVVSTVQRSENSFWLICSNHQNPGRFGHIVFPGLFWFRAVHHLLLVFLIRRPFAPHIDLPLVFLSICGVVITSAVETIFMVGRHCIKMCYADRLTRFLQAVTCVPSETPRVPAHCARVRQCVQELPSLSTTLTMHRTLPLCTPVCPRSSFTQIDPPARH